MEKTTTYAEVLKARIEALRKKNTPWTNRIAYQMEKKLNSLKEKEE